MCQVEDRSETTNLTEIEAFSLWEKLLVICQILTVPVAYLSGLCQEFFPGDTVRRTVPPCENGT